MIHPALPKFGNGAKTLDAQSQETLMRHLVATLPSQLPSASPSKGLGATGHGVTMLLTSSERHVPGVRS